jgi:hypothetical protein
MVAQCTTAYHSIAVLETKRNIILDTFPMEHENMTFVRIHTIIYTHTIESQSNANMTTRS